MLGRTLVDACVRRGLSHVPFSHLDMDVTDLKSVSGAIEKWRPWAMINAAGYVRVDRAEREPGLCRQVNAVGPAVLAFACRRRGVKLLTFSSDFVFDGAIRRPLVRVTAWARRMSTAGRKQKRNAGFSRSTRRPW